MDSGLLQFHLKCAVLRNMKAAAEPIEDFSSECNDELDEVAQMLLKYTDLSAETVSAGLNWWVLEQFFLDKDTQTCQPANEATLKNFAREELIVANTSGSSDE